MSRPAWMLPGVGSASPSPGAVIGETAAAAPRRTSLRALYAAVFDLSRTRQALLSVAQPALGAVLALGGLPSVGRIVLGGVAASAGFLAVFSLNDVLDRRVDASALDAGKSEVHGWDLDTGFLRHPLAAGRISLRAAAVWVGALALLSSVCAWLLSPACLAVFAAAVALEMIYCSLRSVTWLKTFVSGLMVGVGGLAGWIAVAPLTTRAIAFFAFLALWEIAGRNLPNDLADIEADSRTGIRTVATTFGPRVSAVAVLAGTAATLLALVALPAPLLAIGLSLVVGITVMGAPAVRLMRRPTSEEAGAYFNRASLLPALVFVAVTLGQQAVR